MDVKRRQSGTFGAVVRIPIVVAENFRHHPGVKRIASEDLNHWHSFVMSHNLFCQLSVSEAFGQVVVSHRFTGEDGER